MSTPITHIAPLLAIVLATALIGESQSPSSAAAKPGAGQVERITLPQVPAETPPGPNVEVYEKDCLICHSARYVTMQPRFSKTVWQNEVKKMVDAYGATISAADQALIVEYLVAVKGSEPQPSTPAK
jgi:cytochrome c5